ncbi:uncharacterized protein LOC135161139 isoform X2 [Diachasmimorpha longicaudata]|uniref:uncharacterized protein LOC135161139 isoform X2 n=1 Tax=Diachasmimorpha longicaudata TaxID=58733 RepID=UPI0030B8902B
MEIGSKSGLNTKPRRMNGSALIMSSSNRTAVRILMLPQRLVRLRRSSKTGGVTREELLEHHGDAYHNNFSTAYDLSYRVLPRGLSGPPLRKYNACKRTYVPEQDLAKNFGNQYGYGYKEYIQRRDEELIEEAKDLPRSHYRCDYTEKKIPTDKRYPRRRADMNKPDLRHLNIDLDTKWGRLFTHGYHRLNILQQKIH